MQSNNKSQFWRATGVGSNAAACSASELRGEQHSASSALRLVMCGLPAAVAEQAALIAEILGWEVALLPAGPVMRPAADLCLAAVPADAATPKPPITVWSPETTLNEHISRAGLSNLDQPPCVQQLEQLLSLASSVISVRGRSER